VREGKFTLAINQRCWENGMIQIDENVKQQQQSVKKAFPN